MSHSRFLPIFTPEEREQNEARKKALIDLIVSGEALLFVGAGSSQAVGYDGWGDLLQKLERLACKCDDQFQPDAESRINSPLHYAQRIKLFIKEKTGDFDRYYSFLGREFEPRTSAPQLADFHKKLASLPFKGFLTINYDIVLEAALGWEKDGFSLDNSFIIQSDAAHRVAKFLMSLYRKDGPSCIAHLHGRYDFPKTIVLSLDEYAETYGWNISKDTTISNNLEKVSSKGTWTLHRKFLWAILATRRVVFIGFGMTDPYLIAMLQTVSGDLWNWDQAIHYAITSISPSDANDTKIRADSLKRDFAVDVVFYEDTDGSHSGLNSLIAEVEENYKENVLKEKDRRTQPHMISRKINFFGKFKDVFSRLRPFIEHRKPRPSSDWLEEVNRRMEARIGTDENRPFGNSK